MRRLQVDRSKMPFAPGEQVAVTGTFALKSELLKAAGGEN